MHLIMSHSITLHTSAKPVSITMLPVTTVTKSVKKILMCFRYPSFLGHQRVRASLKICLRPRLDLVRTNIIFSCLSPSLSSHYAA